MVRNVDEPLNAAGQPSLKHVIEVYKSLIISGNMPMVTREEWDSSIAETQRHLAELREHGARMLQKGPASIA